jgi:hypothetical protein
MMRPAELPEPLDWRCPACREALVASECADPFAACISCSAGHRFFVMPESPLAGETASAAGMHFPQLEGQPVEVVAAFWLAESAARSALNEQLAELLRIIIENRRVSIELPFSYCPVCGDELSEYQQPDIWVQGLRCSQGHSWASRGGRLFSIVAGARLRLHAEPSDATVARLIVGWLKGKPRLDPQLHESVRRALGRSPLSPKSAA